MKLYFKSMGSLSIDRLPLNLSVMDNTTLNKSVKSDKQNAADSLKWLLDKNPNVKRLIETFDLEIIVKPCQNNAVGLTTKSQTYENR